MVLTRNPSTNILTRNPSTNILTRNPSTNILNSRPTRPILLSADSRRISYRSKSGKVLTLELKTAATSSSTGDKLGESKDARSQQLINVTSVSDASKSTNITKDPTSAAAAIIQTGSATVPASLWPDVFDTVSFWCMEAVECAMFGPYEELAAQLTDGVAMTEPPTPLETPMTEAPLAR